MDAETRRALSVFAERMKFMREGGAAASRSLATVAPRPRLLLVTAENSDALRPQRKRRARPGKIAIGGNVVAFPLSAPRPTTEFDRQKLRVAELLDESVWLASLPLAVPNPKPKVGP
ncbi:hypothetical protein [Tahibacter caeni]|uniref:hypothetical protein n=1 Tax=Tahibacter caeni TaxID=1453545 RepID=UPI0021488C04|nr:hypothetical protein [Tahibacter caeni]